MGMVSLFLFYNFCISHPVSAKSICYCKCKGTIAFNQNTIDGKDYSPSLHLILCELDVSITLIKSRYVGIHFRNGIGNVFNAGSFHESQLSV